KTYTRIKMASKQLMSRVIEVKKETGWALYNVFLKAEYNNKDGCIHVQFHPDMKEHYLNLNEHFTKYSLYEYLMLPSTYSQRLFEILKSWDDQPDFIISVEELQDILFVPDSHRKDYAAFRRRVLEKAHKDIHKHTSLRYEWEPIKTKNKVTSIRFIFSKKKVEEKKRKDTSTVNNRTVLAAKRCFESGTCNPTRSKKCEVCRRYFKSSV
ncbi:replication initiation protein, partial [Desulfovibrio inopinatus]|uniref:replication initiation protein n=1 Tax=Desulfovibrio inopinatus TaxID=102109 RepID=UPI000489828A